MHQNPAFSNFLYYEFFDKLAPELPDLEFVWNMLDEPRVFKNFCANFTNWHTCACDKKFSDNLPHGFLLREPVSSHVMTKDNKWTPTNELMPIFSAGTITDCFNDILIPSHLHMSSDYVSNQPSFRHIKWEAKRFIVMVKIF